MNFLSSKQESLLGRLSETRTQVSASAEPVDAADVPGHTPIEAPGVMSPLPLNQWELLIIVLLLVISLLFFTTS